MQQSKVLNRLSSIRFHVDAPEQGKAYVSKPVIPAQPSRQISKRWLTKRNQFVSSKNIYLKLPAREERQSSQITGKSKSKSQRSQELSSREQFRMNFQRVSLSKSMFKRIIVMRQLSFIRLKQSGALIFKNEELCKLKPFKKISCLFINKFRKIQFFQLNICILDLDFQIIIFSIEGNKLSSLTIEKITIGFEPIDLFLSGKNLLAVGEVLICKLDIQTKLKQMFSFEGGLIRSAIVYNKRVYIVNCLRLVLQAPVQQKEFITKMTYSRTLPYQIQRLYSVHEETQSLLIAFINQNQFAVIKDGLTVKVARFRNPVLRSFSVQNRVLIEQQQGLGCSLVFQDNVEWVVGKTMDYQAQSF